MPSKPSQPPSQAAPEKPEPSPLRRWVVFLLKYGLLAVVLFALGNHVRKLLADWQAHESVLRNTPLRPFWLIAAAAAYAAGQFCFAAFWWRLLVRLGLRSRFGAVLNAYGIGTVGKYVPGKALVVVIRTGMISIPNVGRVWVGLTAVYETLAQMAVGGMVAALCLGIILPQRYTIWGGAAAAGLFLIVVLHPFFFERMARFVELPFRREGATTTSYGWYSTFWRLLFLPVLGWLFTGASQHAVLLALGVEGFRAGDFLLSTGASALATTIGFLILILPAGLGVRELILIHMLDATFGHGRAVLASLLSRTVWTAVELALAGALYALVQWRARSERLVRDASATLVAADTPSPAVPVSSREG